MLAAGLTTAKTTGVLRSPTPQKLEPAPEEKEEPPEIREPEEAAAPKAELEGAPAPPTEEAPPTPDVRAQAPPAAIEEAPTKAEAPEEKPVPEKPTVRVPPAEEFRPLLEEAREALQRGETEAATRKYTNLINRGHFLDEIVADIEQALYRHPVDINLWQTLGDAHMRADRLQEALEAYTKAEELLR
jgi:outer membrane biosynthesis protein TonB